MVPLWKRIIKNSLKIICPSKSIQQLVFNANRNTDTIVLPNGIDLKKFSDKKEKKKKILVVTRMFERKGVQYFLNAIKDINNGFEINIVGDGPYLSNLKEQANELKLNVNFYGFVDNKSDTLKDLYETSLIFVFTSEAENFPIVLLEAMSAGLAIITTEKTGCAEVVGETGLLVPVKDSKAIRIALLKLIDDPGLCIKMGDAARLRLDMEFGWEAIAKKHIALYKNYSSPSYVKLSRVYQY
jgi:glycosyltransferase involved in cell wall biosynthesis